MPPLIFAGVGLAHGIVAWVFYSMDRRTREFVGTIREALSHIERKGGAILDDGVKVVVHDHGHNQLFSYTKAFNTLFGFQAVMGLALIGKDLGLWSLPGPTISAQ